MSEIPQTTWKSKLKWLLVLLLPIGFALANNFDQIKERIGNMQQNSELSQYDQQVEDCVAKAEASSETTIGLEYSCAIDVAATFYANDPDLAIALCMKFGLLKSDEQVQQAACRTSLNRVTKEDEAVDTDETLAPEEEKELTSAREVYRNEKYDYMFSIAQEERVVSADDSAEADVAFSVSVYDQRDRQVFAITALDPARLTGYSGFEDTIERYKLPLADYVKFLEENNDPENVMPAMPYHVDGEDAYQLLVRESFFDGDAASTVQSPSAYIYTEYNGMKYQIKTLAGSISAEEILSSFVFAPL